MTFLMLSFLYFAHMFATKIYTDSVTTLDPAPAIRFTGTKTSHREVTTEKYLYSNLMAFDK